MEHQLSEDIEAVDISNQSITDFDSLGQFNTLLPTNVLPDVQDRDFVKKGNRYEYGF